MSVEYFKILSNGGLLVDLKRLPPSHRNFSGIRPLTIPKGTRGWVKCSCDAHVCQVIEFGFKLSPSEQAVKLTPAKLRCPLCACQVRCFEFRGCTKEDTRRVAEWNHIAME